MKLQQWQGVCLKILVLAVGMTHVTAQVASDIRCYPYTVTIQLTAVCKNNVHVATKDKNGLLRLATSKKSETCATCTIIIIINVDILIIIVYLHGFAHAYSFAGVK